MDADGGGYGFLKILAASPQSAAQAEATCAARGMQLLVPRTPAHLAAAYAVATDPGFGPDGSADYLTLLGVYPAVAGATCASTPLATGNDACGWVAGDGGTFWVSDLTTVAQPDGDNDVASSMAYTFDGSGAAIAWADSPAPGATSARFVCGDVDKDVQPASCLEWLDLGFTTSGTYTIDPDGGGDVQVWCDMDHGGGGWTKLNASLVTLQVSKGTASWSGSNINGTGFGVDCGSPNARQYTLLAPRLGYSDIYVLLHRTTSVLQCSRIGHTAGGYYTAPYAGTYTSFGLCNWTLPWANACPPCDATNMAGTQKDWVMYVTGGVNPPLYYETSCSGTDSGAFTMQWFVR
ncbi:MAG: hypothetical protein EP329_23940 [Deltaproteobacteria bacterium]|nr:MAG: hypothetical protein EP329_23940 [Deltaproteobacteria bacterium]